jgi:hypothetical protein
MLRQEIVEAEAARLGLQLDDAAAGAGELIG